MEIFVVVDGKKTGPMSIYEVRELLRKDRINTSTLAWVKGMTKWEPLKECPPFRNSIDIEIAEADRDSIIINSEERKSILYSVLNEFYEPVFRLDLTRASKGQFRDAFKSFGTKEGVLVRFDDRDKVLSELGGGRTATDPPRPANN